MKGKHSIWLSQVIRDSVQQVVSTRVPKLDMNFKLLSCLKCLSLRSAHFFSPLLSPQPVCHPSLTSHLHV